MALQWDLRARAQLAAVAILIQFCSNHIIGKHTWIHHPGSWTNPTPTHLLRYQGGDIPSTEMG
jgi:hypothetical protein